MQRTRCVMQALPTCGFTCNQDGTPQRRCPSDRNGDGQHSRSGESTETKHSTPHHGTASSIADWSHKNQAVQVSSPTSVLQGEVQQLPFGLVHAQHEHESTLDRYSGNQRGMGGSASSGTTNFFVLLHILMRVSWSLVLDPCCVPV